MTASHADPGRPVGEPADLAPTSDATDSGERERVVTGPDQAALTEQLGIEVDAGLVHLAMTHRSYAYENGNVPTNERLEFLGDAVLGIVITDALYHRHPELPEGKLAKLRASIVNGHALAGVGRAIGLGRMLLLGRGEELTGGRQKDSIVADAVEAVLGAVYLDHGLEAATDVVHRLFDSLLRDAPGRGAGLDWKTSLQELAASEGLGVPEYHIQEDGPDHAKSFQAAVVLSGAEHGTGNGRTKKEAEQRAAEAAYGAIKDAGPDAATSGPLDPPGPDASTPGPPDPPGPPVPPVPPVPPEAADPAAGD